MSTEDQKIQKSSVSSSKVSIDGFPSVRELIEALNKLPQEARVFIGIPGTDELALDMHNSGLMKKQIILPNSEIQTHRIHRRFFDDDTYEDVLTFEDNDKLGSKTITDVVVLSPCDYIYDALDQRLDDKATDDSARK